MVGDFVCLGLAFFVATFLDLRPTRFFVAVGTFFVKNEEFAWSRRSFWYVSAFINTLTGMTYP